MYQSSGDMGSAMNQVSEIETTAEPAATPDDAAAPAAVATETADPPTEGVSGAAASEEAAPTATTAVDAVTEATEAPPAGETQAASPELALGGALVEFRHELSKAMRSAAEAERDRMIAAVAGAAEGHLTRVRTRAAAEADGFRLLAEADVDRIHDWSRAETARIHEEADRRIGARRQQLERHVEQHGSITERELGSIERAVEDYRAELDRFFARLTSEEDPTELARLAGALPAPPDLEDVGGRARAKALDEFRETEEDDAEPEPDAAADAGERPSAFSPTAKGPELVGVMASDAEASSSDEVAAAAGTDASEHPEGNGTLQRLRSLAGLSGPKRPE